ncbi:MAG: aldehyde dehydrogenase family protein, partial [Burkholderiales bacterium]|nr:aldehyde dehydrogenase family protein [Phycisphaerae bacterium]
MTTPAAQLPLITGSQRINTAAELLVKNPYDGSVVGHVAMGDASHLDQAVSAAHKAFDTTRRQPPHERAELLLRVAAAIKTHAADLAATIVAESGKPIVLAEAEVARAVITFTCAADVARQSSSEVLDAGAYAPGARHLAISKRFPLGVVYGMTPFNFPLNLVAHKIAPAIACGATIVVKPSPRTPITALKLVNFINDCGAVPGQVNVVTCPNELAMNPVHDARVKTASFTGSVPVGWQIKQQALKKKVTLELGGNAAVVVHEDADIDAAIPLIAAGAFAYAGQSCISVQRILVHRPIYQSFRDKLVGYVNVHIRSGDPNSRDVLNGPLITAEAQDRVLAQIGNAL